jgi:Ca2+-binding EF-hand superfamily protein
MTIQNANKSINYWVTERPTSAYYPTTSTPTEEIPAINFTAVPTDILPLSAQGKLETLTKEFNEGDWTLKGYSKNRYLILGPYLEQLREWARNVEENPVIKSANVTAPHVNTSTDSLGKDVVAVTGEPQDSPPTRDLKSPPTRDLESPPTRDIESPPTQDLKSPPTRDLKSPPTRDLKSPPTRDLKSPPTRDLKSPPTRDLKSPPTRESPPDGHSPPGGDGPPGLSEVQEGKIEGTSNDSKKEPSNQALPANNSTTGTTTSPTTGTSSPTTGMTSSPTTGITSSLTTDTTTSSLTTDTTTSSLTTDTTTSPTTVSDKSTSQGAPGSRKLLFISPNTDAHLVPSSQELKLAEEIRRGKEKQLRQQKDIKDAIRKWESLYGHWDSKRLLSNSLPWEREEYFPSDQVDQLYREEDEETMATSGPPVARRHLLDTFANSLRHSNQLYNRVYGYVARKVPAHMPHFINRDIMEELKEKFSLEFANTSSHKLRSPYDLQFSFSYFYYLMSEPAVVDHAKLFAAYDTDGSGILSARELRTLLTRVEESKHITAESIDNFQWLLGNCSLNYTGVTPQVTEEEFRTLYDPNFALVTEDFMMQCKPLLDKLSSRRAKEKKYKFEELSDNDIGFKMVNENVSLLVDHLDDLRREPKKFICINDNINHTSESAHLAKLYIKDYYEAVFPKQSQFELPPVYRNRFLKVEDLREWQSSQLLKERLLLALLISVMLSALIAALWDQIVYVKRFLVRRLFARQSRHKTR